MLFHVQRHRNVSESCILFVFRMPFFLRLNRKPDGIYANMSFETVRELALCRRVLVWDHGYVGYLLLRLRHRHRRPPLVKRKRMVWPPSIPGTWLRSAQQTQHPPQADPNSLQDRILPQSNPSRLPTIFHKVERKLVHSSKQHTTVCISHEPLTSQSRSVSYTTLPSSSLPPKLAKVIEQFKDSSFPPQLPLGHHFNL